MTPSTVSGAIGEVDRAGQRLGYIVWGLPDVFHQGGFRAGGFYGAELLPLGNRIRVHREAWP
jgi:hypothetical protein